MGQPGAYNFTDSHTGDTLNEINMTFSAHPAYPLERVVLYVGRNQITSDTNGGITIVDAATWHVRINQQVILFAEGIYPITITFTYNTSMTKTYIKGTWRIYGR